MNITIKGGYEYVYPLPNDLIMEVVNMMTLYPRNTHGLSPVDVDMHSRGGGSPGLGRDQVRSGHNLLLLLLEAEVGFHTPPLGLVELLQLLLTLLGLHFLKLLLLLGLATTLLSLLLNVALKRKEKKIVLVTAKCLCRPDDREHWHS